MTAGSFPERVALFIDGANIYYGTRELSLQIDWKRLLEYFSRDARLLRAFYYSAILEDGPDWLHRQLDWLAYNGYTVVTKPAKRFRRVVLGANGAERVVEQVKGDMDIELAIDMLTLAEHCDRIALFSGDGDLRRLVEAVQQRGVRVQVVSTLRTRDYGIADELRRQADEFIDLEDLRPAIERQYAPREQRPTPTEPWPEEPPDLTPPDLPVFPQG